MQSSISVRRNLRVLYHGSTVDFYPTNGWWPWWYPPVFCSNLPLCFFLTYCYLHCLVEIPHHQAGWWWILRGHLFGCWSQWREGKKTNLLCGQTGCWCRLVVFLRRKLRGSSDCFEFSCERKSLDCVDQTTYYNAVMGTNAKRSEQSTRSRKTVCIGRNYRSSFSWHVSYYCCLIWCGMDRGCLSTLRTTCWNAPRTHKETKLSLNVVQNSRSPFSSSSLHF